MAGGETMYRVATEADLPAITHVRTSVVENHLSVEQLAQRGITNASVGASFRADCKGWVAEHAGQIVAFSIADRKSHSIFALFVLPGFEGRGIGGGLLTRAVDWLWQNGSEQIWLETRKDTRAAIFYAKKGWIATRTDAQGNIHYQCKRPRDPSRGPEAQSR
jgi:GNAT superfamily N-acetyltransferase